MSSFTHRMHISEEMQGMWFSIRGKISCANKSNDVICLSKQFTKQCQDLHKVTNYKHEVYVDDRPAMEKAASREQTGLLSSYEEVTEGDPSRKVIEKILGDAVTSQTMKISKIRRVIRVKHSQDALQKFEKYREMVKQKAKQREQNHVRSMVDGNELLCFYVTTITCHKRQPEQSAIKYDCDVYQVINSSFDQEYIRRFGIQLSMNSKALKKSIATVCRSKKSKRAVIICRVIAGRIASIKDKTTKADYDSIVTKGYNLNFEYLVVNNPTAVLACFVIMLD